MNSFRATFVCSQVKIVRESDHKLVRHEHGDGFTSETTFEVYGDHLTVVSLTIKKKICLTRILTEFFGANIHQLEERGRYTTTNAEELGPSVDST